MSLQTLFVSGTQASSTLDPLLKNVSETLYVQKITHKIWPLKKNKYASGRKWVKKWGLKIRNYHFFLKGWLKALKGNQT